MSVTKGGKSRKLTAREKAERAQIRKELRDKGILPMPKKPLNRKKFCEEARACYMEMNLYDDILYIGWGLAEMLGHKEGLKTTPDLEAVGAAKVILLAKTRKEFEREHMERTGSGTYAVGELFEAVKNIYEA